ncbi:helix-turn-helix domain-containing protein [Rhizobium sp. AQ_MP]|uniref:helix-turn-helix domain-containing protein n=1 Tax=Rhizobium sp. AQ_MP TaxID=2761536 RepID=UPI001FF00B9E|nr:AraC family transcriptional regulator [Rhizobium sp. AQ_MP]
MLLVPLSFLVALFLSVFLVRLLREGREIWGTHGLFLVLLALYVVQSLMVGLRWGYGMMEVLPLLPVMASLVPALSFLAFRDLTRDTPGLAFSDWPHLLPTLATLLLLAIGRMPVDLVIIANFLGYGLALLWLAREGPDGLVAARLDGSIKSFRAMLLTGVALIASALTDVAISLDMLWSDGRYSPMVVSAATTLILLLLGIAAVTAGGEDAGEGRSADLQAGTPGMDAPTPPPTGRLPAGLITPLKAELSDQAMPKTASDEHRRLAADLDRLMTEKRLWSDPNLNLARLARRLGAPARAVSEAVNRVNGMSVSHYVNNHRITEACRLLTGTDMPVTRILFEAGFITKSNFNREFLRVTGESPSDWRRRPLPPPP